MLYQMFFLYFSMLRKSPLETWLSKVYSSLPSDDVSLAYASFDRMLTFDGHNNLVKSLCRNTLTTAYNIASLSSISPPAKLQMLFTRQLTTVSSIQYECIYSLSSFFSTSLWTLERAFHLWAKMNLGVNEAWLMLQAAFNEQTNLLYED